MAAKSLGTLIRIILTAEVQSAVDGLGKLISIYGWADQLKLGCARHYLFGEYHLLSRLLSVFKTYIAGLGGPELRGDPALAELEKTQSMQMFETGSLMSSIGRSEAILHDQCFFGETEVLPR